MNEDFYVIAGCMLLMLFLGGALAHMSTKYIKQKESKKKKDDTLL